LAQELLIAGISMKKFAVLGVGDHFGRSAYKADQLYKANKMDDAAIVEAVTKMF
jgi:transketolase C-terminal domain/subunit